MAAKRRADGKRHRDGAVDVDAHELSGGLVLGHGAHGLAHLGLTCKEHQAGHDNQAGDDGDERDGAYVELGQELRHLEGDERSEVLGRGAPQKLRGVLQEVRHADGRDQNGQRACLAQRLIGQTLNENTENRADHTRENYRCPAREAEIRRGAERDIGTDHDDVAVSEVEHLGDTVDHGVAQRDDGVDAAHGQAVDQVLDKDRHVPHPPFE